MRPGFEVGYELNGKYYVNNHLMFKILVHETNGQYTMGKRASDAELQAAANIEVGSSRTAGCVGSLACTLAWGVLASGVRMSCAQRTAAAAAPPTRAPSRRAAASCWMPRTSSSPSPSRARRCS